jgi:predicted protein tyrosine phosphatase
VKITIKNKKSVKDYIPIGKAAIIRMEDNYPYSKLKYKYDKELELYFSDIDYDCEYSIQKTDAEKIIKFLKYIKENDFDELVVQCEYGQGRSPAIAFFAAEFLEEKIEYNIKDFPDINNYVYNFLKVYIKKHP